MDNKNLTVILGVATGLAVFVAGFQAMGRAEARRQNTELELRVQGLEKEKEQATATEQALRAELAERTAQAEKAAGLQAQIDRITNPPENAQSCVDSDQNLGAESIYVRGSIRTGGAQSMDHCRLGQLVEFSCIENPVGSGRFLADAKIMDCPAGSRCVSGECLR